MKKWFVRRPNETNSKTIVQQTEISPLCADILSVRGCENAEDAKKKYFSDKLLDPFMLKDMKEAADIINEAIDGGERICIYGDYDCDGITSTVMLYSYLELMGADVMYRLPERSEGYGLNKDVVKEIAENGTGLIITVDTGIAAIEEAELIYSLGMKLVVTDHHQPGEQMPKAEAIVNPHRKDCPSIFKSLCGAGVVLKLIAALEGGSYETALNEYCEIAAIGTVADIVELSGENRFIVSRGLEYLENSNRPGINALMKIGCVKSPVNSTSIAFAIAPRINASGRFGSPTVAARLLLTEDEDEAEMLAGQLDSLNNSRKQTENDIIESISAYINENPRVITERVMVLSGKDWHHGVIGIVAARMVEKFDRPCFVITIEGGNARGSARAFGSFSVYKALDYCKEVLTRYGGHMGAGGFSLKTEDIPKLEQLLLKFAKENFNSMPVPDIIADKLILPTEITVENIDDLKILQPFGEGNPQPVFAISKAELLQIMPLSKGVHTKLRLKYGGVIINALLFRHSPDDLFVKNGDLIDLMVTLETQVYNGNKNISIIIQDFRKNGTNQNVYFGAKDTYEKYKRGEQLESFYYKNICPDRQELVDIYKRLLTRKYDRDNLYMDVSSEEMNYCKMSICVDIFDELELMKVDSFSGAIDAVKNPQKKNLENSCILQNLKAKIKQGVDTL